MSTIIILLLLIGAPLLGAAVGLMLSMAALDIYSKNPDERTCEKVFWLICVPTILFFSSLGWYKAFLILSEL